MNNNCSYLLIRYELNCCGRATLFIQIRENKVIVALRLLTFEFFILGFHVIFITRQFFCNYSLFVVSVIVTSNSLHFVKLPTDSSQTMLVKIQVKFSCGRCGGLMVSALDSGSGGPGSSPGQGTALCSWARHFTLIVPLSTQVYKWVPANLGRG